VTLLATPTELAVYLQSPQASATDDSTDMPSDTATLLLTLASGLVTDILGVRDSYPTRAKAVVLEAAARAYRNPDGHSSRGIDDWQEGFESSLAGGSVYLTKAESAEIRYLVGRPGVASVVLETVWQWK
jgi:hypothetical protein